MKMYRVVPQTKRRNYTELSQSLLVLIAQIVVMGYTHLIGP